MKLGRMSGCHQMPNRSIFIRKYQMPVCARCFGVILGNILALIVIHFVKLHYSILIMLCIPMALDWSMQKYMHFQSTNLRRVLTGFLCGFSTNYIYLKVIISVFTKIIAFISKLFYC